MLWRHIYEKARGFYAPFSKLPLENTERNQLNTTPLSAVVQPYPACLEIAAVAAAAIY